MARGKTVDRELVELILQMKERNPKLTTEQIGAVMNCDASTAGKIIKCGSWEGYCRFKDEKARKEREKASKTKTEESLTISAEKVNIPEEEQVPGQLRMDLDPAKLVLDQKAVEEATHGEQVKLMRFLAGRFDLIEKSQALGVEILSMKLEKIYDMMGQILKAVRKE